MSRLVFGRYKLESRLGGGGMGEVFLAKDLQTDEKIVVKISKTRLGGSEKDQQRVLAEASLLSRLDHPGIAKIFDCGTDDGEYFYVMEYVDGVSLINFKNLSLHDKLEIFRDCAKILGHIHSRGIVHRDIKPENIMILPSLSKTAGTRVNLIDFGLAFFSGKQRITDTGHVVGTLNYMAPELLMGFEFDYRADLYSLGVTMFYVLTGRLPIESRQTVNIAYNILNVMPEPPSKFNSEIPQELDDVVLSLLRRDPKERIQTAQELASLLDELLEKKGRNHSDTNSIIVSMPTMFGREKEIEYLFNALNSSQKDSGCIIVVGPDGIGKSRLAEEFAIKARFQGAIVLKAHGINSVKPEPLYGLRQLFWSLQQYPVFEAVQKKTAEFVPLASMNPNMVNKYKIKMVNTKFSDTERIKSFETIITGLAKVNQVVFVIDDFSQLDRATVEMCLNMIGNIECNFLLLMTTDDLTRDRLAIHDGNCLSILQLTPIEDLEGLIKATINIDPIPASLVEEIKASTGGVPILVLDQLRSMVATDSLRLEDGTISFHTSGTKSGYTLDFVSGIVNTLTAPGRLVLDFATVFKWRFSAIKAAMILGLEQKEMLRTIDELVRAGLLESQNEAGTFVYWLPKRFSETLSKMISDNDFKTYHKLIAQTLQNDTGTKPEWVFEHFRQAGNTEKAVAWAIKACRSLIPERSNQVGKYIDYVKQAAVTFGKINWTNQAKIFEAQLAFANGKHSEAIMLIDQCSEHATQNSETQMFLDCLMIKSSMLAKLGNAKQALQVRLEMADQVKMVDNPGLEFEILDSLARSYLRQSNLEKALDYSRQAFEVAKDRAEEKMSQAIRSLVSRLAENHLIGQTEEMIGQYSNKDFIEPNDKLILDTIWSHTTWLKGEVDQAATLIEQLLSTNQASSFPPRRIINFTRILQTAGHQSKAFELLDIIDHMELQPDEEITAELLRLTLDFQSNGWMDILTKAEQLVAKARAYGRTTILAQCLVLLGDMASHIPNLEIANASYLECWRLVEDSTYDSLAAEIASSIMTAINQPLSKNDLRSIALNIAARPDRPDDFFFQLQKTECQAMSIMLEARNPLAINNAFDGLNQAKAMSITSGHKPLMGHITKLLGKLYAQEYRFSHQEDDKKKAEQNFFESEFIYRSIGANWLADFVSELAARYLE